MHSLNLFSKAFQYERLLVYDAYYSPDHMGIQTERVRSGSYGAYRTHTVGPVWLSYCIIFDKTNLKMIVLKYFKMKRKYCHDNVSHHVLVNLISSRKSKFSVQFIAEIVTNICLQYTPCTTMLSILKCFDKRFHLTSHSIFYQRVCILPMPIFHTAHGLAFFMVC